jgi:hypothetical protein
MRHRLAFGAAVIALALSGCSDDDETTTSPKPRDRAETPDRGATPPNAVDQLPPQFVKCMADRGFEVESSADIHSAPPDVLQACFGSLHSGGAR